MSAPIQSLVKYPIVLDERCFIILYLQLSVHQVAKDDDLAIKRLSCREGRCRSFQNLSSFVNFANHPKVKLGDNQALIGFIDDQTVALKLFQGFTNRRTAYAKPLGQIELAQPRSRL